MAAVRAWTVHQSSFPDGVEGETIPQGLKPAHFILIYGTAKAVPFQSLSIPTRNLL
jgi:hypothetical protein